MRRKETLWLLIICLFSLLTQPVARAVEPSKPSAMLINGAPCPVLNSEKAQGGYEFKCVQRLKVQIWASTAVLTPPYFVRQDVLQSTSLFAPKDTIEYVILWNGEDVHGVPFPSGTTTSVKVDGRNSNYLVTPEQPITLFLPNVPHIFIIVVYIPGKLSQSSIPISVAPLNVSLLTSTSPQDRNLKPPVMACQGSGEVSGFHPGWSSSSAIQLTAVDFGSGSHALFWCPAAAPNGSGIISYIVTTTLGGLTCETTLTTCLILGFNGKQSYQLTASDQSGSYAYGLPTIQSSETSYPCIPTPLICNTSQLLKFFPTYGNVPPLSLGDCTFAAVADWEHIVLGSSPDATLLGLQFSQAGGTASIGLSDFTVFAYWKKFGITGTVLTSDLAISPLPENIRSTIDDPKVKALIASLHIQNGQYLGGARLEAPSFHWVVVDGYTPQGPLVVTWGQTIQMTWQQWNQEVGTAWKISVKSAPTNG